LTDILESARRWLAKMLGSDRMDAELLPGTWRLVRVAGQPPAALRIKSLILRIERDGDWFTEATMADGRVAKASGQSTLKGTLLRHTSGRGTEVARVSLSGGRLTIDPDFGLLGPDGALAAAEYERVPRS
jgi:hypothetical protein